MNDAIGPYAYPDMVADAHPQFRMGFKQARSELTAEILQLRSEIEQLRNNRERCVKLVENRKIVKINLAAGGVPDKTYNWTLDHIAAAIRDEEP